MKVFYDNQTNENKPKKTVKLFAKIWTGLQKIYKF